MSDAMLYTPSGCVLYLDLRKVYGDKVYDYSGHGNHGTIYGAKLNMELPCRGLEFDGEDDFVEVPHSDVIQPTRQATIEELIYPRGPGSHPSDGEMIVNKENSYEVARTPEGEIKWAFMNNETWNWVRTGYVVPLRTWSHVVVVYESADSIKTYGDGVLVHEGSFGSGDIKASTYSLKVAARELTATFFEGIITLVRIYNRALSSDEVKKCFEDIQRRILRRIVAARDVSVR